MGCQTTADRIREPVQSSCGLRRTEVNQALVAVNGIDQAVVAAEAEFNTTRDGQRAAKARLLWRPCPPLSVLISTSWFPGR